MLKRRYLFRSHEGSHKVELKKYIETRLHEFITDKIGIPDAPLLKRASPKEFLSPSVMDHLKSNGFKVARVLSGRDNLLLIDGITLGSIDPTVVQQRATQIAYGYYRINQVRETIAKYERRNLYRSVVLFHQNGPQGQVNPHEEYALEVLKRDSDMLVSAESPSPLFINIARDASHDLWPA